MCHVRVPVRLGWTQSIFCIYNFQFQKILLQLLQRVESVDKRAIEVPAWDALVSDIGIAGSFIYPGKREKLISEISCGFNPKQYPKNQSICNTRN